MEWSHAMAGIGLHDLNLIHLVLLETDGIDLKLGISYKKLTDIKNKDMKIRSDQKYKVSCLR